ncbi:MAG: hypothetical protein AAB397_00680 [Patescibacteria group bacterium]
MPQGINEVRGSVHAAGDERATTQAPLRNIDIITEKYAPARN